MEKWNRSKRLKTYIYVSAYIYFSRYNPICRPYAVVPLSVIVVTTGHGSKKKVKKRVRESFVSWEQKRSNLGTNLAAVIPCNDHPVLTTPASRCASSTMRQFLALLGTAAVDNERARY